MHCTRSSRTMFKGSEKYMRTAQTINVPFEWITNPYIQINTVHVNGNACRCPKYQTPLPPQCKMETDPLDSCCQQPKCTFTPATGQISGTIAPYMLPTKLPGIISGQANTPAPTPRPDGTYPSPKPLGIDNFVLFC